MSLAIYQKRAPTKYRIVKLQTSSRMERLILLTWYSQQLITKYVGKSTLQNGELSNPFTQMDILLVFIALKRLIQSVQTVLIYLKGALQRIKEPYSNVLGKLIFVDGDTLIPENLSTHPPPVSPPAFKDGGKNPSNVHSGGQVISMKWRHYFTSVTGKINQLLLIHYPFSLQQTNYCYFKCNEIVSNYFKK